MDTSVMQQVLDEMFPALEALETPSGAIMQFLKERGIVNENDLASFVEQEAKASNVRWRAARLRIDHLLSGAARATEESEKKDREKKTAAPDTKQNREASQKVPESPKTSTEHPEPAEKTTTDVRVETRKDTSQQARTDEGKKEENKKKDESRGTEKPRLHKPNSKDAA